MARNTLLKRRIELLTPKSYRTIAMVFEIVDDGECIGARGHKMGKSIDIMRQDGESLDDFKDRVDAEVNADKMIWFLYE